jgi:hypothetical protein
MHKAQLLDKHPVKADETAKSDTDCANALEPLTRLRERVKAHPGASLIAEFDHLAHVRAEPQAKVAEELRAKLHPNFCLGNAMPNAPIPAERPRAVSVVGQDDKSVVSWLEAPVEARNLAIAGWVEGLRRTQAAGALARLLAHLQGRRGHPPAPSQRSRWPWLESAIAT